MKRILKQVVGIDVSQKELVVSLGRLDDELVPEIVAGKTFVNSRDGFLKLEAWVSKLADPACPVRYVMEATGVYHESLAYFIDDQGYLLSIILPNKISNYQRTLEIKTVTDKSAALIITRFGLERMLDSWTRPRPLFKKIRQLTREREQVVQARTVAKNQLHAEQAEAEPGKKTVERLKKQITLLNKQEMEIRQEIQALVKTDEQVAQLMRKITSLPGIGVLTAATVLAETNGFELVRNKRQLASYAGYDVREKQSGTSVRGRSQISKRGNKYLRKAMHMPALAAVRKEGPFKTIYLRLIGKHGLKMKALVAVQRRLLEMCFVLYKTNTPYDEKLLAKTSHQPEIITG